MPWSLTRRLSGGTKAQGWSCPPGPHPATSSPSCKCGAARKCWPQRAGLKVGVGGGQRRQTEQGPFVVPVRQGSQSLATLRDG